MTPLHLHSESTGKGGTRNLLLHVCLIALLTTAAFAQPAELQRTVHEIDIDSGLRASPDAADDLALHDGMALLFQEIIRFEGAPWIRLQFSDTILSGNVHKATGSKIRIMSLKDGAVQWLDAVSIRQWRNTSAYFNGDAVLVQLFAHPRTGLNRVAIDRVIVGEPSGDNVPISICDGEDERELSFAAPDARALPAGCTAFLINDERGCMMTAGHCVSSGSNFNPNSLQVVEFNPPLSNPDGTMNFAPPEDQYATDSGSFQFQNNGCNEDWAYFGVVPNSVTGLMPMEAQGEAYDLGSAPTIGGLTVRVRGYGTAGAPLPPEWNLAQKTHDGEFFAQFITPCVFPSCIAVAHQVDTTSGNSGSAVYLYATDSVIGVHTCGGCQVEDGVNLGTAMQHPPLQSALNDPQGVCTIPVNVSVPADHNTIQAAIDAVPSGSVITVGPGTYHEAIDFAGKSLTLRSTDGPEATIIDAAGTDSSAVRFTNGETPLAILDGFTVTGGTGSEVFIGNTPYIFGGGILIQFSSPTIVNCIVQGNTAEFGGGIFNYNASPLIENTIIADNAADPSAAGGVYNFFNASPQFINVEFRGNSAETSGGAMSNQTSHPAVIDSRFIDNHAVENGGAVRNTQSSAGAFIGNTFENNSAGKSGGAFYNEESPEVAISQSIFCENTPDHIAGDFTDEGGNDFLDSCTIPGDLTGNGVVNVDDLLIALNNWGECDECESCLADITGDCVVDEQDIIVILANWG